MATSAATANSDLFGPRRVIVGRTRLGSAPMRMTDARTEQMMSSYENSRSVVMRRVTASPAFAHLQSSIAMGRSKSPPLMIMCEM